MSIAITPFKQQLLPQEEKLEVGRKKAIFYWYSRKPATKNAVFV
jgi:hypothetical protein